MPAIPLGGSQALCAKLLGEEGSIPSRSPFFLLIQSFLFLNEGRYNILLNMTEEEKKVIIGDLYEKLNKAQQGLQHQSVLDHTDKSKYHQE